MDARRTAEMAELVSSHMLLGHLAPGELERLLSFARTERFAAGDIVFRKGDPGHSMMAVVEGRIKISVSSPDGREAVLAVLGRGEVLGEMAILEGRERSADATAIDASELLVLHSRDVIPFLERNPEICIRLLRILSERLRRTSELVEERTFLDLAARLAKALLDLAGTDGGDAPDGIHVDLGMSQKNFAAVLGASRERVNKQLGAWQAEGLIRIGRGSVVLIEPEALSRIVDNYRTPPRRAATPSE